MSVEKLLASCAPPENAHQGSSSNYTSLHNVNLLLFRFAEYGSVFLVLISEMAGESTIVFSMNVHIRNFKRPLSQTDLVQSNDLRAKRVILSLDSRTRCRARCELKQRVSAETRLDLDFHHDRYRPKYPAPATMYKSRDVQAAKKAHFAQVERHSTLKYPHRLNLYVTPVCIALISSYSRVF